MCRSVFEWEKEEPELSVSERRRREARRRIGADDRALKARGVSIQLRGLGQRCKLGKGSQCSYIGGLRERCELPHAAGPDGARPPNDI